ncbi:hypothetical protein chiPu_0020968 [Chiloscyllium punctatum]|uniref:Uncharacterized protein n=1 Tax=Chiloscyllium punctatum TaxID=137246 RepID=A0A401RLZ9_CHIPU|nr:hypothetical protein [Chiloscyllium punctatum]
MQVRDDGENAQFHHKPLTTCEQWLVCCRKTRCVNAKFWSGWDLIWMRHRLHLKEIRQPVWAADRQAKSRLAPTGLTNVVLYNRENRTMVMAGGPSCP